MPIFQDKNGKYFVTKDGITLDTIEKDLQEKKRAHERDGSPPPDAIRHNWFRNPTNPPSLKNKKRKYSKTI